MIRTKLYSVRLEYRLSGGTSLIRQCVKAYNEEFALDIAFECAAIQFGEWGYDSMPRQKPLIEVFDISNQAEEYMNTRDLDVKPIRNQLERCL